jgi:hypothetical protein
VRSSAELAYHVHRHTHYVHKKYRIAAVNSDGLESVKIKLKIKGQKSKEALLFDNSKDPWNLLQKPLLFRDPIGALDG